MLEISKVTFLVLPQFICTYFLAYGQVSFNCVIIIIRQFIHGSIDKNRCCWFTFSQTKRNLNTTKKRDSGKIRLKKSSHKENAVEMYDANLKSACEQNLRANNFRSVLIFQFVCFVLFFVSVSFLLKNAD